MNKTINRIILFLKPFKGIIFFLVLLFFFHFFWKIAIYGDMPGESFNGENMMCLFGIDITPSWFDASCRGFTQIIAWFIQLFPNTQDLIIEETQMRFSTEGNIWISIVWGCLGLKQMTIYACIILFYWGPFLKKLWYIPLGCFILTVYNVIRVAVTVLLTDGNPERFDSLHDGILRYIYYTIVFLLWVVWAEFIDKNNYKYAIRSSKNSKSAKINAD